MRRDAGLPSENGADLGSVFVWKLQKSASKTLAEREKTGYQSAP
jgi:hypothetical protein